MEFILICLVDVLYLFTSLFESHMLQQKSYNAKKKYLHFFLKDVKKNLKIYLLKYLFCILLLIDNKSSAFFYAFVIAVLALLIFSAYENFTKHNEKLKLKFTSRMIRIMSLDYLFFILFEIFSRSCQINAFLGMVLLYICLHPFILMFIIILLTPVEKMVFNHYKSAALEKLGKMNNLKIIGITGSFGKTSTKMVLNSILASKYKGFFTPSSFNTPNGILKTINSENTIFNDYFICEMGATKNGEIKQLSDLVKPKYAILTSIGAAHLETFKSIENVCKTKFELVESLGKDGLAVLNKDDRYQRNYKIKNKCNVIWIGIQNKADVMAQNISVSSKGTTFDIYFKNSDEAINVTTSLLGSKNIYNILASVALAKNLGLSNAQIISGVKNIKQVAHRLELKEYKNMLIIDDSFNSNPVGAKTALEVLSLMDGIKVIITPGMVEMGKEEEKLNYEFGREIAKVCDKVYLVGKNQTKPIYDGLKKEKYDEKNIKVFNKFKDAYNDVLKSFGNKKVCVLIENDLPDSYTED